MAVILDSVFFLVVETMLYWIELVFLAAIIIPGHFTGKVGGGQCPL